MAQTVDPSRLLTEDAWEALSEEQRQQAHRDLLQLKHNAAQAIRTYRAFAFDDKEARADAKTLGELQAREAERARRRAERSGNR